MAFEGLADKLQNVFKKLTGKGKLSEADIKAAMREVKLALLEADVNFLVVKQFIKTLSEKAVGKEILESLTPDVYKRQNLVRVEDLLGELESRLGPMEEQAQRTREYQNLFCLLYTSRCV